MIDRIRKFPLQGWVGIGLIAVFWPVNWLGSGPRSHWAFFPLWLGYCLLVDGLVFLRKNSSLLRRDGKKYLSLFLLSIPLWWLFEALNLRLENWIYLGKDHLSPLAYGFLASLSFSTVIPAVLGSAELIGSFPFLAQLDDWVRWNPGRGLEIVVFITGWIGIAVLLIWPRIFFPLVWLSLYFIIEPVNRWVGNRTILDWTRSGDWRILGALFLGVWLTAFFWEFWNFWSYPKWIYHIAYLNFGRIFEMPVFGYFGYLPFSLEIYAFSQFSFGLLGWSDYFDFLPE